MLHAARQYQHELGSLGFSPEDIFLPGNDSAYAVWRAYKLANYPASPAEIMVKIRDPLRLSPEERRILQSHCRRANMAFYELEGFGSPTKSILLALGRQLGMSAIDKHLCVDDDGVSPLHVSRERQRGDYIPYTNRPINWHTDGYYNPLDRKIQGMILHCESPAASGGDNALVDHEIAYIHLRDRNPDYVFVLMQDDVMEIPANIQAGRVLREAQTGPVFSLLENGKLHMRYTARTRYVNWKSGALVAAAVQELQDFLAGGSAFIFRCKLEKGQGVICNNVLHKRNGFVDDPTCQRQRLLYRLRYYDGISQESAWKI